MGSFEYETQRTNPAIKSNHTATDTAETEEEKHLKSQYKDELTKLQELFTDWTEADLLFALQEAQGDLELTITRISEGHASQWGEVRSRKSKKEQSNKAKTSGQQSGNAQRGHQRGGYSDRGRPRGEGGSRSGRNDRSRGPKRDNSSGYTRPPRQQNGPSTSNHDDTNVKSVVDNWGNSDSPGGGDWNDANESWSSDSKGLNARGNDNIATNDWSADNQHQSLWGDNSAENSKSGWDNDSVTDKGQNSWTNEVSTESNHGGRNGDSINNSGGLTADNKNGVDNVNDNFLSREADKSNFKENNNWDTETSNNNWNVENNWPSDSSKDNRGADSLKNGKTVRDVQRSPNPGVPRSIVTARSPVPNISRTIPSQPKASWAQIVKPESKPDPKPEPVSPPIHKSSPENIKVVSPKITKSPIPVQSSPPTKIPEPISLPSPPEETTVAPVVAAVKTEEIKVSPKEISSPEQPAVTPAVSSPVVNVSSHTKEISPPGIINKTKPAPLRRLKQDAAVVMPSAGAGLERVGVQFGSLNLSNSTEEITETEAPIQRTEERSPVTVETSTPQPLQTTTPIQQQQQQQLLQQQLQQQSQVQPQSVSSLSQTGSINRSIPTTSVQNALPSSVSNVPSATPVNAAAPTPTPQNFNPSYFKQEQTSAYLNQQHHLGLATEPLNAAPYGSYLPNSGFSMGPIQSLPEYGALYGPDAQRMMGYYADPAYNQASPVTSAGYQGRGDNKYTPDTTTASSNQTTSQQSAGTQQQSTNQQQGQNPQQQAYPLSVQYYPYYYMANQFPSAYQQSGYGQPFVNKSMYPMYNHPHSTKPGSASGASPYGYPTTPTTPNNPHHYSHTSNTGYDEITAIHHLPGVHGVHDYPKAYGGVPPLNFLGNAAGNNPQPTSGSAGSNSTGGKTSNNGSSELNSPAQYKGYTDKASAGSQQAGVGQSGAQQQQQPNPNYYGQQAQQMFNNYQYQQTHHQYHPHQAHHQAAGRNQQQYWSNQS